MKMNRQAQTFARQVQVDLLALSDTALFKEVQLWVHGKPSGPTPYVSEETRLALGYTPMPRIHEAHALLCNTLAESEVATEVQWQAPTPERLRELLTAMDIKLFIQHVLPLAFQTLHPTHLEWGEGSTFNAHLANHLRAIGTKR
jgi:hypothetical protein